MFDKSKKDSLKYVDNIKNTTSNNIKKRRLTICVIILLSVAFFIFIFWGSYCIWKSFYNTIFNDPRYPKNCSDLIFKSPIIIIGTVKKYESSKGNGFKNYIYTVEINEVIRGLDKTNNHIIEIVTNEYFFISDKKYLLFLNYKPILSNLPFKLFWDRNIWSWEVKDDNETLVKLYPNKKNKMSDDDKMCVSYVKQCYVEYANRTTNNTKLEISYKRLEDLNYSNLEKDILFQKYSIYKGVVSDISTPEDYKKSYIKDVLITISADKSKHNISNPNYIDLNLGDQCYLIEYGVLEFIITEKQKELWDKVIEIYDKYKNDYNNNSDLDPLKLGAK